MALLLCEVLRPQYVLCMLCCLVLLMRSLRSPPFRASRLLSTSAIILAIRSTVRSRVLVGVWRPARRVLLAEAMIPRRVSLVEVGLPGLVDLGLVGRVRT